MICAPGQQIYVWPFKPHVGPIWPRKYLLVVSDWLILKFLEPLDGILHPSRPTSMWCPFVNVLVLLHGCAVKILFFPLFLISHLLSLLLFLNSSLLLLFAYLLNYPFNYLFPHIAAEPFFRDETNIYPSVPGWMFWLNVHENYNRTRHWMHSNIYIWY